MTTTFDEATLFSKLNAANSRSAILSCISKHANTGLTTFSTMQYTNLVKFLLNSALLNPVHSELGRPFGIMKYKQYKPTRQVLRSSIPKQSICTECFVNANTVVVSAETDLALMSSGDTIVDENVYAALFASIKTVVEQNVFSNTEIFHSPVPKLFLKDLLEALTLLSGRDREEACELCVFLLQLPGAAVAIETAKRISARLNDLFYGTLHCFPRREGDSYVREQELIEEEIRTYFGCLSNFFFKSSMKSGDLAFLEPAVSLALIPALSSPYLPAFHTVLTATIKRLLLINETFFERFLSKVLRSRAFFSSSYRVCLFYVLKALINANDSADIGKYLADISAFLCRGMNTKNELVANVFLSFWKDDDFAHFVLDNGSIMLPQILPTILIRFSQRQWLRDTVLSTSQLLFFLQTNGGEMFEKALHVVLIANPQFMEMLSQPMLAVDF